MEAQELRIGNIIYSLGQKHEGGKMLGWINYEVPVDLEVLQNIILKNTDFAYSPIPLTEEWLLKLGFIKEYGSICLKLLQSDKEIRLIDCNPFELNKEWSISAMPHLIIKLKYVHQLQNLYFALTGEELTI